MFALARQAPFALLNMALFPRCRRLEALHLVLPSRPGSTTPLVATIGDKTQAKSREKLKSLRGRRKIYPYMNSVDSSADFPFP